MMMPLASRKKNVSPVPHTTGASSVTTRLPRHQRSPPTPRVRR
jgi:hypothetical protein